MRCLICGGTRLTELYDGVRDHYGIDPGAYRFLACGECGSASLDPLPDPERLAAAYDAEYTFKPTTAAGLGRLLQRLEWRCFYLPAYRQRLRLLRRLTGLRSGRVLEVGCGSGLFLHVLRAVGYEVEGVEPSSPDARYARDHLGLRVVSGGLETPGLRPGRYDVVLLVYVLEHLPDPRDAVRRIHGLLRPGGWVVLGLPVIDSGQARLLRRRWSAVTEAPRHVSIPSVAGARRLLEEAGFQDIRAVPSPLLENAGHVALSLVPGAASPRARKRLLRRAAGALCLVPGLVVACAERVPRGVAARAGTMFFAART